MRRILAHSAAVRNEVQFFLERKGSDGHAVMPWVPDLINRLKPYVGKGKLLRGSLLCFSYEMFAGSNPSSKAAAVRYGAALELLHSALLIHDDIMDQDDVRRGQPAIHAQYRHLAQAEALPDSTHFGNSMAICSGDMTLLFAFELLAAPELDSNLQAAMQQLFSRALSDVCAGQMQDLYLGASVQMPPKRTIDRLMQTKTALYTVSLPLVGGATLAGQNAAVIKLLQIVGETAGIIFQIRDDELGIGGDAGQLGKPVGSDVAANKKTLPAYYLFRLSKGSDLRRLEELFGQPDLGVKDLVFVRRCLKKYGVDRAVNNQVEQLSKRARRALSHLDLPDTDKEELESFVTFCARRRI